MPCIRRRCDCLASSAPFTNIQTYLLTYLLEFDTDHLPVVSTLAIRLKRLSQKRSLACTKFNLKALQDKTISQQFEVEIRNRFSVLDEDDLDNWETLRDSVQEVAKEVLGLKTNSKQDWISDSTD